MSLSLVTIASTVAGLLTHLQVQTVLEYRNGRKTHLLCCSLFLVGFLFHPAWCFCWVPYATDSTKDVYHINPLNGDVVGVFKRMGKNH